MTTPHVTTASTTASSTASTTASKGLAGKALTTAKLTLLSPVFGAFALGGIIVFEWWKGKKDAEKLAARVEKTT